jgi:hypothetical protein
MSRSGSAPSTETRRSAAGVALFCVAGFLLVSMGGAIVAAPLTVPLMFLVTRRHPTPAFRVAGAVLTGATVAEVVWALTYVAAGEAKPWIWILPLLSAIAATVALVTVSDPQRTSGEVVGE